MQKKTLQYKILSSALEFEELCAQVFEAKGITVERNVFLNAQGKFGKGEIDLVLTNNNYQKIAVEVKYYRTRKPNKLMLEKATKRIKVVAEDLNIPNQILIIGMPVDQELKAEISDYYNIEILDSNNLLFLIDDNEDLLSKFNNLMNDIPREIQVEGKAEKVNLDDLFEKNENVINIEESTIYNVSERFWSEIEKIPCGKSAFIDYEDKCTEILKHLFDENLNGWNKQLRTDDGLNRYDLICRVKKGNEFWEFLINEFYSRYIVFEFKNYCKNVKQTQVYTTEKYLFQKALRNVCFMISREGLDDNGLAATKRVLRENGKLIINLRDEDLYKMLKLKDSGDEPSDYLFEIVDEILLKLSK